MRKILVLFICIIMALRAYYLLEHSEDAPKGSHYCGCRTWVSIVMEVVAMVYLLAAIYIAFLEGLGYFDRIGFMC